MNRIMLAGIIYAIFLSLPSFCQAQADTAYFDDNWKGTDYSSATYYRVRDRQGKQWKVTDYYIRNDKPRMTGYYKPNTNKFDGMFVFYDDKGHKTEEGMFSDSLKTGHWQHYYKGTDALWYTAEYMADTINTLTSYYKSGKLKRKESHLGLAGMVEGKCYSEDGQEIAFSQFFIKPIAEYSLPNYLATNIKYPEYAINHNIEGRVIIRFVVYEDGSINNLSVMKNVGGGCDEEAVRVLTRMPRWKPGTQDGSPVKVYFTQPVSFKLTD